MALWGKTDQTGSRPKWINLSNYPAGTQLIFVDETEAQQAENKARGLTGAGWWLYRTYTDSNGSTRYDNECLVALTNTAGLAGDAADDAVAADRTITITANPPNRTVATGAATTFTVTASVDPTTTLSYQWQISTNGGTSFSNVTNAGVYSNATTATLSISDVTGLDGRLYRVNVSATGATTKTSTAGLLTVTV